jgi:hypothetical protein
VLISSISRGIRAARPRIICLIEPIIKTSCVGHDVMISFKILKRNGFGSDLFDTGLLPADPEILQLLSACMKKDCLDRHPNEYIYLIYYQILLHAKTTESQRYLH